MIDRIVIFIGSKRDFENLINDEIQIDDEIIKVYAL